LAIPAEVHHIVSTPGVRGGKPCIKGHRIAVHDVAIWHRQGQSPEQIAETYELSLAEVYAALSYYYDHKEWIDRESKEEDEEVRRRAREDTSELAERVRKEIRRRRSSR
jgi:uncharacterized protein (DUF433 family)